MLISRLEISCLRLATASLRSSAISLRMLAEWGRAFTDNGLQASIHASVFTFLGIQGNTFLFSFLAGFFLKVITLLSRGPILTVACSPMSSEKLSLFIIFFLACVHTTELLTYKPRISLVHHHSAQNLFNLYVSVCSFHSLRDVLSVLCASACVPYYVFCVFLVTSRKAS